jgi:Predicted ATPase
MEKGMSTPLLIARTPEKELLLLPGMANRHGLITGATGTGKTVTLQKLAESFSAAGVPVFMADVKGDLTGISQEGAASEKLLARLNAIGVTDWQPQRSPVALWDIFGEKGHPVRATVSDLGPLLLARLLNLNEVQTGVLNIIFRIADDQGLLLLDFKDLRAITQYIGDTARLSRTSTAISAAPRSGRSSAGCSASNSRARRTSSASPCWIL